MRSDRPKLLYLVTEDWYFLSHRLPMACRAQQAGYEVHVVTHLNGHGEAIKSHGFTLHPVTWRRGSLNPFTLLKTARQIRALYRKINPDIVHHVALQPSIVGSLAALGLPFPRVNALAGLGFAFTSRSAKARALRLVLATSLRLLFRNPQTTILVQNPDDRGDMHGLGVPDDRTVLIPGSGVDTLALTPLPEPAGEVTVAFVGRLLADKGVQTLIAAHQLAVGQGASVRLLVAGDADPANPASIPAPEIERWRQLPLVEMLGHVRDIKGVWARSHVAVLPSRREGLPKSLLEAAAYGRPLIATDVPGCREIARHDVNALLVPVDDPGPLAGALTILARDSALRRRLGSAGRGIVESEFSSDRIGREIVELYDRLLGRQVALLPVP